MTDGSGVTNSGGWVARRLGPKTASLLDNVDFRRLYLGHLVSQVGDELYFVAAMWLVYELTGSTLYTGVAGFLFRLPQVLSVAFGPLVDRSRLGRLLVRVESLQGVAVLAVPVAAALGRLNVFVVLAVVPLLALLRRVAAPAEQATLPRIVDDDELARANSLTSATRQALGASAQAVSGALIAVVGAVALFLFNAATFAASTLVFSLLSVPETEQTGTRPTAREYLADIREGLELIRESVVGHMVVAVSLAGVFTGMATAVLPAFADGFGGAGAYGLLVAATTVGMLVGSLVATRFETIDLGRVTVVGFLVAATGRLGAVAFEWPPAAFLLFGAAAVPVGVYNVLVSATIQTGVPNRLLARVSSTVGSLVAVVGPAGFLVGGFLGGVVGSAAVVGLSAVGYVCISLYWLAVPSLRGFPSVSAVEDGSFGV